eukprot:3068781-Prymnesium_polylepis.1
MLDLTPSLQYTVIAPLSPIMSRVLVCRPSLEKTKQKTAAPAMAAVQSQGQALALPLESATALVGPTDPDL